MHVKQKQFCGYISLLERTWGSIRAETSSHLQMQLEWVAFKAAPKLLLFGLYRTKEDELWQELQDSDFEPSNWLVPSSHMVLSPQDLPGSRHFTHLSIFRSACVRAARLPI
jgi:hypothetical protein